MSVMGRQRLMGDAVRMLPGLVYTKENHEFSFYAIFHSEGSGKAATFWRDVLHLMLLKRLEKEKPNNRGGIDWVKVMKDCFAEMEYGEECMSPSRRRDDVEGMVVVVTDKEVILSVKGDSKAVLFRGDSALFLSHASEADRVDKRQRNSYYHNPYIPCRESIPEVIMENRTLEDEFLIIASNGLWEVISDETAYDITRTCLIGYTRDHKFQEEGWAAEAAGLLAELAMAKGGQDNMSIIVVHLKTV
ncbi:probable protein phosphatase 2C 8 [Impatiens glandulifera]|uniref:probable protein phosphatase 2C 8 n=1 Tax=Impatiens glandulifera TaxID=253017 RepID=UPI001FB13369|nr:probable protein phosphatase 2C 8 [Impatiens glandulifera]